MKKRFIAALSALALVLALPVAAIAAPSPSNTTVTGANGVTASVDNANVTVASTTTKASNTPAGANVVASFEITENGDVVSAEHPLTVTFTLGKAYAGAKVTIYVQHNDGSNEVLNLTADNNGNVTFKVEKLSIYTIVAEPTNAAATTDNGSKSPATGVNTAAMAAVAGVAVAGAACAFVALRKNN